jgi:ABC-type transport system involved in multi-copper enzyme maturation permease subunit
VFESQGLSLSILSFILITLFKQSLVATMVSFSSLFTAVVLYTSISYAAPLVSEKRGIQDDQLNTFKLMGQYSAAAYCASNYSSPGDQVQCASGNCPLVETADSATTIEYDR